MYENNYLKEVTLRTNISKSIFVTRLIEATILRTKEMEVGKFIMDLKIVVNYQYTFGYGIIRNTFLKLLGVLLSYMVVKVGAIVSLKNCGKKKE